MDTESRTRVILTVVAGLLFLAAFRVSPLGDLLPFSAQTAPSEVVIDRTFDVRPGELLNADLRHVDLTVRSFDPGSESTAKARVQVVLEGRDMDRAHRFLEHLNFKAAHENGELRLWTDPGRSWNGSTGGAEIDVMVTVPETFDADVVLAHGDIGVDRMDGTLAFEVRHGDLHAVALSGSVLDVSVQHGDLEAERYASEKIRVSVQHGDVELREVTSTEVDVAAAHGDVDIAGLEGFPRIRAEHGDISVRLLKNQGGEFEARHGDIELHTDASGAADVEFDASDVEISAGLNFEGTRRDGEAVGRVNGGGPRLVARATHGDVQLRTN